MIENKPSIYNGTSIYNGGGAIVEPSPFDFFTDCFSVPEKGVYQNNNNNRQVFNGNISSDNEIILDVLLEDLVTNRNVWCYLFQSDTDVIYISTKINPGTTDRVFSVKNGDPNPFSITIPNGANGRYTIRMTKNILEINGSAYSIPYASTTQSKWYLLPSKWSTSYPIPGNYLKQTTIKNGATFIHDWVGCKRQYDNTYGLFDNVFGNYILSTYAGGV